MVFLLRTPAQCRLQLSVPTIQMARLSGYPGSDFPADLGTLDLLEEIIYHGIEAGYKNEAWDIYWNRLGGYKNLGWRIGAYERGERNTLRER